MPESRLSGVRPHAGKALAEPAESSSEHRVVVGIIAVPLLPGDGSSLLDPPSVAREVALVHDGVGKVAHAVLGKDLEEVAGTDESGVEVLVVFYLKFVPEGRPDILEPVLGDSHAKREHIASIVSVSLGRSVVEDVVEGLLDVVCDD